jgi:hypothetical protein
LGVCFGFIGGALEGAILFSYPLCIPDGVTVEQISRVVVAYADKHPEKTHERLNRFIYAAVRDAWPCKVVG